VAGERARHAQVVPFVVFLSTAAYVLNNGSVVLNNGSVMRLHRYLLS
jgi:hypothetical protein